MPEILHVHEGTNYGYDGSDWSISSHADIVFAPSTSPVQLEYLSAKNSSFPDRYLDEFYIAMSGLQGQLGPGKVGDKSVVTVEYDFEKDEVIGRPHHLLKYRGPGAQMPVNVAAGPDGLYMVALHPDARGVSAVFKISYDH